MRSSLQAVCQLFIENRDVARRQFRLESDLIHPMCANLYCARGERADENRIEAAKRLLKEETSVFSSFRGNVRPVITCMLAMDADPETRLKAALAYHGLLKERFWGSDYLALVAFFMTDLVAGADEAAERIARGRGLYDRMKKEHPFLTGSEDSVFAVLMAFAQASDDELIEDMECSYAVLKAEFSAGNAVQAASQVLALTPGLPGEKVDRMMRLYEAIRAQGGKYGRQYQLATLAAASALAKNENEMARDMLEVDGFLAGQKGYGPLRVDRKTRMMHAAMIVSDEYSPRGHVDAAALTGVIAMIAAQQAAMCAAATSAAAGSGH